jgi:hypothetical protein
LSASIHISIVKIEKVIRRSLRRRGGGIDVAGDLNAVVAANVGERGQTTKVSSSASAFAGSSKHAEPAQDREEDR